LLNLLTRFKYHITIVILLLWILFFAQYDVFTILDKRAELKNMDNKITYLEEEIKKIEKEKELLRTNPQEIEKQSRERYFMKKDNEDVFVYDTVLVK